MGLSTLSVLVECCFIGSRSKNKTEYDRKGLKLEGLEGMDWRGMVRRDYSLFNLTEEISRFLQRIVKLIEAAALPPIFF